MSNLDEELARVRKEWYDSNVLANDATRQAGVKREELLREVGAKIEAEFGERIRSTHSRSTQLWAEVDALENQIRTRDVELPYPVGTKLLGYELDRWSDKLKPSGKAGQIEVITEASLHPANIAPYSRAKLGMVVVRVLKKDGSPSSRYEGWSSAWSPNFWRRA